MGLLTGGHSGDGPMSGDRFDHLFIQPGAYDASLVFYRDVLQWEVSHEWGGGGEPRGACLTSGGVNVVLAEPHDAPDHSQNDGAERGRPNCHLQVDDLDRRFEEVVRAGGIVLIPPEQTHWGTRWFVVQDPDGNRIAFEQPLPGH